MTDTLIHRRVAAARAGDNPSTIARLHSGWVVVGDVQVVHGYCLLLPDPVVPDLNALAGAARAQFLADMAACGDALLAVTLARRINYEILGNLEPALHAHLFPRYDSEPAARRHAPVWQYDWSRARPFAADEQAAYVARVRAALDERGLLAP